MIIAKKIALCILLCVLLTSYTCRGQDDTIYYDYSANAIIDKREAIDYYVYEPQPDNTFIGKEYSAKNNILESIGNYLSLNPIVLDGHIVYYEHGSITREGDYDHNKQVGKWLYYFNDQKKIWYTETFIKKGKIKLRSYYPTGKLKRKEKHNDTYTKATGKCYNEKGRKIAFTKFYTAAIPSYPIEQYLSEHLEYPTNARDSSIEGTVVLKYIVNENGNIANTEVIKGIAGGCNHEAVRVISSMPKWSPAIKDDRKIKVTFYQQVSFHIE